MTAPPRSPDPDYAPDRFWRAAAVPSTAVTQQHATTGRRRAGNGEAGQAAIQTAILLSIVLFLIIGVVQGTVWFAGRQVAIAAASEGARVAAAEGGTAQAGQAAAVQFAGTAGRGFLQGPRASVTRTETTATVTLTGTTQSLVSGGGLSISQTAAMPVERLTAPVDTGTP
ncbi:TadE family protein [Promicromonospora sp. NPDC057138]|uniref:TadE family protein n=1 Tax=Promicromonospora sp. NPDC057138 TaxID=3346031 RepID=UPI0036365619